MLSMGRPKKEKPNRSDGRYEVKIKVGETFDGKAIRKSFYSDISLADAKRKGEEYKVSSEVQAITGQGVQQTTAFKEWATKWLEIYKKPYVSNNTYLYNYKNAIDNHIMPYFEKSTLQNIKPIDIQKFYASKRSMSMSALEKIKICLDGIFETAIDNDLIFKSPARNIKLMSDAEKNIKNVYTTEQMKIAKQFFINKMPEVYLLLCTGLRRGEMLGLKWEDIDFKNSKLSVKRTIANKYNGGVEERPPKWNSYRDIPLEKNLSELLQSIPRINQFVFPNQDTIQCQYPSAWSRKLSRYMEILNKKTGLPVLSAHELRHTYGTELRRRGIDIYTIQKIMGHRDLQMTTEIYVHNEFDVLKKSFIDA